MLVGTNKGIYLNTSKESIYEEEGSKESYASGQQGEDHRQNEQIPHALDHHKDVVKVERHHQIVDRERQSVHSRRGGRQEAHPPPVIVLGAEQRVGQNDADLAGGDQQDQQDREEEPEEVVPIAHPHGGEEEVQLHEDHAERNQTAHGDERETADVPRLRRDLARNRAGGDGRLVGGASEPAESAENDEREGETEPNRDEFEDGEERDRGGGVIGGEESVLHGVDAEDHAGEQRAGEDDGSLEVDAAPAAIEVQRDVAVGEAH